MSIKGRQGPSCGLAGTICVDWKELEVIETYDFPVRMDTNYKTCKAGKPVGEYDCASVILYPPCLIMHNKSGCKVSSTHTWIKFYR